MVNKDQDKTESQNAFNLMTKRNDILFFNEELYDENYGMINSKANLASTTKDFGFPNFKMQE